MPTGQDDHPRHPRPRRPQQGLPACEHALIGDAKLTPADADRRPAAARLQGARRDAGRSPRRSRRSRPSGCRQWLPLLTSDETPLTPYRVLWDLQHTVDMANTIITHDAGSPRDQLSPFWKTIAPLTYIGWGKTTQLGYGLGLAMGAKLACPTSSASTSGATPRSASPAWISRRRCASASRSSRSCSTTSAMAIELDHDAGRRPRSTARTDISRRLCRVRPRARRLWRAGDRARGDRPGDPARHRGDRGGPAGAARVHHLPGDSGRRGCERGRGQPRRPDALRLEPSGGMVAGFLLPDLGVQLSRSFAARPGTCR